MRRLPERNQDNQTIQTDAQRLYLQQQEIDLTCWNFKSSGKHIIITVYIQGGRRVIPGANNKVKNGETVAILMIIIILILYLVIHVNLNVHVRMGFAEHQLDQNAVADIVIIV